MVVNITACRSRHVPRWPRRAPRDLGAFHVASPLPDGFTVDAVAEYDDLAFVRTRVASQSDIYLGLRMGEAVCGSRPFDGPATEAL